MCCLLVQRLENHVMDVHLQSQPFDYAREVASLVAKMSVERAAQVYDFVRFLQSQPTSLSAFPLDDDDWLADSEEQMQAEDARWDATYDRHQEQFSALAAAARAEIAAGITQPMFLDDGNVTLR
jgi:DNA-binding GntR family transcriptional regulator